MTDRPTRDLSALTQAPASRTAGLAGGLGARRPRAAPAPSAIPRTDDSETDNGEVEEPAAERSPKTTRRRRGVGDEARAPAASGRKGPWPVYIPADVAARMDAALGGQPYSAWFLDSYRHVHARLAARFPKVEADDSGLPPRPMGARRDVDHPREIQLRLTDVEQKVLNSKIDELGGPTRSAFATAVIEERLEQLSK